jgi:hypothetical protein
VTRQARQDLRGFLKELEELLGEVDRHPEWFPEELVEPLRTARADIGSDFTRAHDELSDSAEHLDGDLSGAGLTGPQLDLKLTGFRRIRERFRSFGTRSLFRRALRWADVILGSLAGVVGAAEPIKEFKEGVEAAIEDRAAEDRGESP